MSINNLKCLALNLKEGKIDKAVGKELLQRAEAIAKEMPGDPNKAVEIAAKHLQEDMNRQAISLNTFGDSVKYVKHNMETLKKHQVKEFITTAVGRRVEDARKGSMELYASYIPEEPLTDVENISLLKAFLGEETPRKGAVADAYKSISEGNAYLRRSMQEFGEQMVEPPENAVRVQLRADKLARASKKEFSESIRTLDTEHLVTSIPYFHKIEGGLEGYLSKMYDMMLEGPAMHKDLDWGVNASKAIADFQSNIYAKDSTSYLNFANKFAQGDPNIVGDYIEASIVASKQVGRMAGYGGDIGRYTKFLQKELQAKDLYDNEIGNELESWGDFVSGRTDQWSHRHKEWKIGNTGLSVKPYAAMSAVKTLSMVKVQTGGVMGAVGGDLITINKSLNDVGLKSLSAKEMAGAIEGDKALAARMGLSTEWLVDRHTGQTRLMQEDLGSATAQKIARWSSYISGLEQLTTLRREIMMFNLSNQMVELDVPFRELDVSMKESLHFAGIGEKEWLELKAFDWKDGKGGRMMDPVELSKSNPVLARKLAAFNAHMKENGIPTNGIAKQKYMKELIKGKGPVTAAFIENAFIFQGWASSMYENHLRTAYIGKNRGNFVKMAALLSTWQVATDALYNLANGETTNFSDPALYYNAIMRSGAFSVFGEAFSIAGSDYQTIEGFLGKKLLGVTFAGGVDIGQAVFKAAKKAYEGKEYHLSYELLKIAEGFNPLSKIWHTRYVYDKTLGRYFREMADEDKTFKEDMKKRKRLFKQGREEL